MPVELKVMTPARAASMNTTMVQERERFAQEAEFCSRLLQAWGLAGADAGETSAGYQRMRPLAPAELVERAIETTTLAFAHYREQGWIIEMPSIEELMKPDDRKAGF